MLKSEKSRNKYIVLLSVLLAAALVFSGCAGTSDQTQPASQSATDESADESSPETTSAVESEITTEPAETTAEEKPELIRVAALKGPTGMGMAGLADRSANDELNYEYEFSFAGSPDDITAKLISGQLDIAALPTNLAAVLYQKMNQEIQLLAINTLGVLYILEAGDTVNSISDLAGKELLATGQGSVPEYVLDYLVSHPQNRPDKFKVTYKAEHAELATLAASGQADLVMLPEPFVTTVLSKRPDMRIALDLTREWQTIQTEQGTEGDLAMGCLVVSRNFADKYPAALESFLEDYKESTEFTNSDPQAAGVLIAELGILGDAGLAAKAIPNCYITMIAGDEMQPVLEPLLKTLLAANPQSVGGKLPDAGFYYGAQD
jgi:NitT/TauT family transport system substrate-binding protein